LGQEKLCRAGNSPAWSRQTLTSISQQAHSILARRNKPSQEKGEQYFAVLLEAHRY